MKNIGHISFIQNNLVRQMRIKIRYLITCQLRPAPFFVVFQKNMDAITPEKTEPTPDCSFIEKRTSVISS